ncbi:MAG TPA: gamma-glutamyl-gamma-aminobutyrate hydrolase family protein [Streptosporangiaceae bacterium]|jgi:gamma-glutamyl-gamma-aminobutyrate hydrolase PuuD
MARSLIGITGQLEAAHWGDWVREAVLSPVTYTRAVERAGGTPAVLPPVPADSVARLVQSLDGLVLTGGTDLNPALYDAAPHDHTEPPDRRRDRFELSLARAAIEAQLPVLAIGRGMHILNVARGGTLIQHLPDAVGHRGHAPDPVKMSPEDVQFSAGSQLGKLLGARARVPTLHHQAIQRAGSGLIAVAWAEDQVIEAVELQGHRFAIGVQWHPEEGDDLRVFEALVAGARETDDEPAEVEDTAGDAAAGGKAAQATAETSSADKTVSAGAKASVPAGTASAGGRKAGGRKAGIARGART